MNTYVEYALVDVEPEDLATAESVDMDPHDRHVLAAALSADADILLTDNARHFPREWMTRWGIELLGASDLLLRLTEQFPDELRAAHRRTTQHSPKSEADILATLERSAGPEAAEAVRRVAQT